MQRLHTAAPSSSWNTNLKVDQVTFANQDIGNLVNEEFEESSSLAEQQDAASSALGVDSLHDNDFQPRFIEMTEQVIGDLESGKTLGRPE